MSGAITGPIALYNNVPATPQYFQPWRFAITGITLGQTTTLTLTIPSTTTLNYVVGQQVRLNIPPTFGCRQLNNQTGFVTSITLPNQITINLNSQGVDPYIASSATTPAQVVAIGSNSTGNVSSTGRSIPIVDIPGSFINISPAPGISHL